jgi:hypothetical protein
MLSMAFGSSSSKQNSQSQQTSQQLLDPQIKSALLGNLAQAQSLNKPYQPYTGEMVAPLTAAQNQAGSMVGNIAAQNTGGAALNSALNTTNSVAGYKPMTVNPTSYAASTTSGVPTATAAQIDPNAVQNVTAPTVGADQINGFMNPYTDNVVNTTLADLERQRQIQNVSNAAQATNSGAWGGSGHAVLDSLTNEAALRAEGSQSAALRSAGYSQALTAAQQQAAQQLQAVQGNQNTNLAAGTTNAGFQQQTGLANQATQAEYDQANQAARNAAAAQNAQAANTAAGQNQAAGLQGASLNLQAGAQQGAISAQQLAQALGIANAVNTVGQQQQTTQQAQDTANLNQYQTAQQYPLEIQQLINQSLGLAGNPVLGSSSGSSTGSGSSSGFNFDSGFRFGGGS